MKPAILITILSALTASTPSAAGAQQPVDTAMIARIRAEALQHSHVMEAYETIADRFGPRLTAGPSYRASVDWVKSQLAAAGLANVHVEPFDFGRGWVLDGLTLEMTAPRFVRLIGDPEAWTPSTKGELVGTPVYVGDKSADEINAMAARIRGAIVLMQPARKAFIDADRPQPSATEEHVTIGAPPTPRNDAVVPARDLTALLQKLGAGAVLRPSPGEDATIFVTGDRNTQGDAVPSLIVAGEQYNMIVRMLQSGLPVTLRVQVRAHYDETDRNGYNIVAEIPGTDLRDQIVMLGAHLDSWHGSNGATDNADAVAAGVEAMRVLHAIGAKPRRTIRLAIWGGEEEGLLGSKAYVDRHLLNTTGPHDNVVLYLNDDPGKGLTYGFYMEQNAAAKSIFDAWLAPFKDLGARKNVIEHIGNTDHLSFIAAKVPAFNTLKDYSGYDVRLHHTNVDFFERNTEAELKESAIVMAAFAWQAANREGQIPLLVP
jgi:carboxypeptidase Q